MSHKEHLGIDYLARVEGETAVSVDLDGAPSIELRIFEPPRFFEGFLVGRKFDEAGDIVSRICGICPVSHMSTAIQAVERAMGIEVSVQTRLLRKIMTVSQICASHLLHLYMLAMPDYYGLNGIPDMISGRQKGQVGRLMRMKELMNDITGLIGGRALHPVTHLPGGFTRMPEKEEFVPLLERLKTAKEDARDVVSDIARLEVPQFRSGTEYVALDAPDEYAISGGRIRSTRGLDISVEEYEDNFQESQVRHAFAKQTRVRGRSSIMVGALARLNIKYDKLGEETKSLARKMSFTVPCDNPFMNNLAQALEIFDGAASLIGSIGAYRGDEGPASPVTVRPGEGCAITEAPRGLLYYRYKIDRKGVIQESDIVTPTSHNSLNLEKDLLKLVDENRGKGRDTIRQLCEKLVRAYDPCFSCSVH
ncbi:MAG: Ni/Fe hydrogenase subunit alpha [Deltaproteobacteria bacterium]